jgi:hypothetical protein
MPDEGLVTREQVKDVDDAIIRVSVGLEHIVSYLKILFVRRIINLFFFFFFFLLFRTILLKT